jgi:hypothetical protein|tara:strand:+ start:268 stop:495 length:228 start_codon:yes stop_codon:yes gene_type:complete
MIEKGDTRRALLNVSPYLLNALRKINRVRFEDGGSTDKPPTLADYMELGLKLATLSDQERDSIKFMLKQLEKEMK